jgi:hypothetical protein
VQLHKTKGKLGGNVSDSDSVPAEEGVTKSELDPKDKELFLKTWGFKDGEISDDEILMAIHLGHL